MAAEGHRKTAFSMRKHFQPHSDGYFHIFTFSFLSLKLSWYSQQRTDAKRGPTRVAFPFNLVNVFDLGEVPQFHLLITWQVH